MTDRPTCPVCAKACEDGPVERFGVDEAATHFCPRTKNADRHERLRAVIRRLWGADETAVYRCRDCGFGFGWPHVGGDEAFYSILHESPGYPSWRWEYDKTAALLDDAFPQGGRVLDIGTGDGSFLLRLQDRWKKAATESTEVMRRALRAKGIEVYDDLDAAARAAPASFHAVTLFQVIEHVASFRPMLEAARRLLAPGGLVVASAPDGDAIPVRQRVTRYPDMPPNHINRWTPASLAKAFEACGFEPVVGVREPPAMRYAKESVFARLRYEVAYQPRSFAARSMSMRGVARRAAQGLAGLGAAARIACHLPTARLSMNFMGVGRAPRVDAAPNGARP